MQERREARFRFRFLVGTVTLLLAALPQPAATATPSTFGRGPPAPAEGGGSFARDLAPIFDRWCISCHGVREQEGDLRLDDYVWLMRGGDSGPAVIPGDPAQSLLIAKIERRDRPAMPPRRRLPAALVARLRAWIAAGAPR